MRSVRLVLVLLLAVPCVLFGQDPRFANKRVPFEPGFRVYYITDTNWRLGASFKSAQWFEPLHINSNRSTSPGLLRCFLVSGLISTG